MKLAHFGFFLVTLSVSSSPVLADNIEGLADIYEKALRSDPQISAAKFARDAGLEKQEQGLSQLLPEVGFSASIGYSDTEDSNDLPTGDGATDNRNIGVSLTQPLFNATRKASYDQSKFVSEQAEWQYKIAEQDLILRVAQAYFDVLSAEENLGVAVAQTRAFEESLARANLTFKVGTATKTDQLEAQARYDLAVADQLNAENQLAIAKQTLDNITGATTGKLKVLNSNARLSPVTPSQMSDWVELARENNLELKLSNTGVEVSNKELDKLKNDRLPVINLVASGNNRKQYFGGRDITTTSISAAVELSVSIYTGGLMSSRIREAEYLRAQQKDLRSNTQRQVVLQAQQSFLNASNGFQQVNALRQALISSESALEATQKGLEVGVRTNLDVLDSQQQYFSTERDYIVAKFNYLLQILSLKAAAGLLSADDIKSLDALLNNG